MKAHGQHRRDGLLVDCTAVNGLQIVRYFGSRRLSPRENGTFSVTKSSLSRDGTCEGTWRTREGAGVKKRLAGRTQHMMLCAPVQSDIPNSLVVHLPCTDVYPPGSRASAAAPTAVQHHDCRSESSGRGRCMERLGLTHKHWPWPSLDVSFALIAPQTAILTRTSRPAADKTS